MEALVALIIVIGVIVVLWKKHNRQRTNLQRSPKRPLTRQAGQLTRLSTNNGARREGFGSLHPETSDRPKQSVLASQRCWNPPGQTVLVSGRTLLGGMVYLGSDLSGVSPYVSVEPALIDPRLPIKNRSPDHEGAQVGYWPAYSGIPPASRAAYLDWLEDGRPPGAYIGYVFLFFYGIERRVLFDAVRLEEARAEIPVLLKEVERLIDYYGKQSSFRAYACEFLSAARLTDRSVDIANLEAPMEKQGWELPLQLKLALGIIVAAGNPLPASWALSWVRTHPEIQLRTAAHRCANEFNQLFTLRYGQRYGDGLRIKRNKTPLKLSYHPASASFAGSISLDTGDLPDVSILKGPVRRLEDLAQTVTDELDAYSRWVGRRNDRVSLAALSLLPSEIAGDRRSEELQDFLDRVEGVLGDEESSVVAVPLLTTAWPSKTPGKLTANEAGSLAELLERHGYGIAPDIRYCDINLSRHRLTTVFRVLPGDPRPSEEYRAATVLLHLGAAVNAADGTVTAEDERMLEGHLEQALKLPDEDRVRLRAYLKWLLAEPPKISGMKARVAALDPSRRHLLGRFALTIAASDGHVSVQEVKVLSRIYTLLELEIENLHSELHTLVSEPAAGPVIVVSADEDVGYRIPAHPVDGAAESKPEIRLDHNRIADVMASTREVTHLLTEVFEEPLDDELEEPTTLNEQDVLSDLSRTMEYLDWAHSELVRSLSHRPLWPRSEIEALAGELGLMPAGAIEVINEAAFESCGEPLVEGDDPLEMNEDVLKVFLDGH